MRGVDLTFAEATVLSMIEMAANAGVPCPKNAAIIGATGQSSVSGASKVMDALVRKGRIKVYRGQCSRVVEIVASGKRTAGEIPAPHWRDRESGPDKLPRMPRAYKARLGSTEMRHEPIAPPPVIKREPCGFCGVRADQHAQFGCRRFGEAFA